jgi:hypothetical protein
MLPSREFFDSSDDFIVITADIDDSLSAEIPLVELFDLATFTLVDNYLHVLHCYVIELLEDIVWIDEQSFFQLLCSGYSIYHNRESGRFLPIQNKWDLQCLILQTLRDCNATNRSFAVPLIAKFSVSNTDLPRRKRHIIPKLVSRFVPCMLLSNEVCSIVVDDILYAVKDTDSGHAPNSTAVLALGDCVESSGMSLIGAHHFVGSTMTESVSDVLIVGSGIGSFSNNCGGTKNNNDISSDDLADVGIVVENIRTDGYGFSTVNANGRPVSSVTHHHDVTNDAEDDEMPPGQASEQRPVASTVVILAWLLLLNGPSTTLLSPHHCLSVPSVLMRHRPIDRGRGGCDSLGHIWCANLMADIHILPLLASISNIICPYIFSLVHLRFVAVDNWGAWLRCMSAI